MGATSIHIKECIIDHSVKHNLRQITPNYVRTDLSHNNEKHIVVADLNQRLNEIKELYTSIRGQKMQKKATPIREGVIVIDEHTTMGDLRLFGESCKAKWGITPLQYFIHRDEGHYDENKQWKPNLHAHIVFDWQNKVTGKSCKLNQNDMRDMQTLLAECLSMERGIQSDKRHLDHVQYKIVAEEEKMAQIALKQTEIAEKVEHIEKIHQQAKEAISNEKKSYEKNYAERLKYAQKLEQEIKEREDKLDKISEDINQKLEVAIDDYVVKSTLFELLIRLPIIGKRIEKLAKFGIVKALTLVSGEVVKEDGESYRLNEKDEIVRVQNAPNHQAIKASKQPSYLQRLSNPFLHKKKKKGLGF